MQCRVYFKSTVLSDMVPFSLIDVYRRFGGTYCLHLQGRRISKASDHETSTIALRYMYCFSIIFFSPLLLFFSSFLFILFSFSFICCFCLFIYLFCTQIQGHYFQLRHISSTSSQIEYTLTTLSFNAMWF
jgi:hypothetical protein